MASVIVKLSSQSLIAGVLEIISCEEHAPLSSPGYREKVGRPAGRSRRGQQFGAGLPEKLTPRPPTCTNSHRHTNLPGFVSRRPRAFFQLSVGRRCRVSVSKCSCPVTKFSHSRQFQLDLKKTARPCPTSRLRTEITPIPVVPPRSLNSPYNTKNCSLVRIEGENSGSARVRQI
ncbi:hypothetical protein Bbelb_218300 [Branchiostoma belcheri]|nr:hypothetical protein Bbelb_218300 [Branchiostoma belcheri]